MVVQPLSHVVSLGIEYNLEDSGVWSRVQDTRQKESSSYKGSQFMKTQLSMEVTSNNR